MLALWTIRPRLMAIPGVANVAIWGQRDRQFQVLVDPDRLRANGVTLDAGDHARPRDAAALGAGGFVDTPNQRLAVRHVSPVDDAGGPGAAPSSPSATARRSRLGDVADVVDRLAAADRRRGHQRRPGPAADRREAARGQHARGDARGRGGAGGAAARPGRTSRSTRPSSARPRSSSGRSPTSTDALLIGCVLVVVILVAFLFDWRTAVISLTAIPLSLVAAALVLHCAGGTINTMVLAGLVIALGEVVDDAIIDVENIVRRLRLNRAAGQPAVGVPGGARRVARGAQRRRLRQPDRRPGVPAGLLPRRPGRLVLPAAGAGLRAGDPGLAAGRADGDAGAVAACCCRGRRRARARRRWSPWLKRALPARCCRRCVDAAAAGRSASLVVAFVAHRRRRVPLLGEEFLPNFQETDFLMHWVEKPGTSLEAMRRITVRASQRAAGDPRRAQLRLAHRPGRGRRRGRRAELHRAVDQHRSDGRLRRDGRQDPGGGRRLSRPVPRPADLPEGADQGGADRRRAPRIVVRIYGPDLDVLRAKAEEVGQGDRRRRRA